MQKVYLVCGVSGSGKSWVCERLADLIHYHSSDRDGKVDPTRSLELHDRTVHISTTIKDWRAKGMEVIPVFVMGDFLQVKLQIKSRGGKITKGLYRRWKRMKRLAPRYSAYTGSSTEVLKWLRRELAGNINNSQTYKRLSKVSLESEANRIEVITRGLNKPEARQKLSEASINAWNTHRERMTKDIKKSRSTDESRAKTRAQVERLKNDPAWIEKLRDKNIKRYESAEEREKTSAQALKARAKPFVAYKGGIQVGTWTNQKFAAIDLGIPACSISRVLHGKLPHAHGYIFKYLETDPDNID